MFNIVVAMYVQLYTLISIIAHDEECVCNVYVCVDSLDLIVAKRWLQRNQHDLPLIGNGEMGIFIYWNIPF